MKQTFTCLKFSIVFFVVNNYASFGLKLRVKRDYTDQSKETLLFTPSDQESPSKKWQIGRVSRKQYEVINMIWRRTNIFVDVDNITEIERANTKTIKELKTLKNNNPKHTRKYTLPRDMLFIRGKKLPLLQYSTPPSYIEFFYLEEITNDENINIQTTPDSSLNLGKINKINNKQRKDLAEKNISSPTPRLIFQLYDSSNQTNIYQNAKRNPRKNDKKENNDLSLKSLSKIIIQSYKNNRIFNEKTFVENDNTDMATADISNDMLSSVIDITETSSDVIKITSAKNYDRVKFFDIYDSATEDPAKDNTTTQYFHNRDQSGLFEYKPKENKNSISYITKVDRYSSNKNISSTEIPKAKNNTLPQLKNIANSTVNIDRMKSMKTVLKVKKANSVQLPPKLAPRRSKSVNWTEYPYVAAYIYDRYKVHCDAVVISAHWLMAAGSCLSRYSNEPNEEGRTAYVTYCGNTWWNPDRITYVKYSVVHPMFNPTDRSKKYLYNIGLIQVVTSMASVCPIWEPVLLMSYHYIGNDDSVAVAVGWGLDRYGVKYISSDIPKRPLSVYAGSVYSGSCPGNSGYQNAADEDDQGLKNVYCLALPNYSREDLDPLHGGLLVVGGKLIALFLQEERRMLGDQAAEYTGVWRLLPWVTEMAREPEETDFSLL